MKIKTTNPDDSMVPKSFSEYGGLTKREYFAALALQGMLADPNSDGVCTAYAHDAVLCADALITALNKAAEEK